MPKVTSTDETKTPRAMRRHPKIVQAIVDADQNSVNVFDANSGEIQRNREKMKKHLQRQLEREQLQTEGMRERIGYRLGTDFEGHPSIYSCKEPSDTLPSAVPEESTAYLTHESALLPELPAYIRSRRLSEGGVKPEPNARHIRPSTPSPPAQKQKSPCVTPAHSHATPQAPSMPQSSQCYATVLSGVPLPIYPFAHTLPMGTIIPHQLVIPPLPYPLAPASQLQVATGLVPIDNTVRTGKHTSGRHHCLRNRTARRDHPYFRPPRRTPEGIERHYCSPSESSDTSIPHSSASQVVDAGVSVDEPQDRQPPISCATTTELHWDYRLAALSTRAQWTTCTETPDHAPRSGPPLYVHARDHRTTVASAETPECRPQEGCSIALYDGDGSRIETGDLVRADATQRARPPSDEPGIVASRMPAPAELTSHPAMGVAHSACTPDYRTSLAPTFDHRVYDSVDENRQLSLQGAAAEYARDYTFGAADPGTDNSSVYYCGGDMHCDVHAPTPSQAVYCETVQPRATTGIIDQPSSRNSCNDNESVPLVTEATVYDTSAISPSSSQADSDRVLVASSPLEACRDATLREGLNHIFGPTSTHALSAEASFYDTGFERPAPPLPEVGYSSYEDVRNRSWQSLSLDHDPLTVLPVSVSNNHPYHLFEGVPGSSAFNATRYSGFGDV